MLVPNRHGSTDGYRYGFQGQEKDDEIKGEGNSLNYTFRMHDTRVGRFFAVNPLTHKYPWYTPYQFSGNKVIQFVELEGLEEGISTVGMQNNWERQDEEYEKGKITKAEYFEKRTRSQIVVGLGGAIGTAGAIAISGVSAGVSAYGTYSTWYGTTALSNYFASGATGTAVYNSLATQFTFKGFLQSSAKTGFFNGTTNLFGQIAYNDFKIDEEINWAQPIVAGFIGNPFYSNFGESFVNLNFTSNGAEMSTNNFNGKFFSSFVSNFIGGKIGDRFNLGNLPDKSAENVLNMFSGSAVESFENVIGNGLEKSIESFQKGLKDFSKVEGFSSSSGQFGSKGNFGKKTN